jgi:hypothetical protein
MTQTQWTYWTRRAGFISGILALLLLASVLAACGGQVSEEFSEVNQGLDGGEPSGGMAPSAPEREASDMAMEAEEAAPASLQEQQQNIQRLIIKNANISLEVESVPAAERAITAQVEGLQGYVVNVETNTSGNRQYATIVFRVPAERFDEAITLTEEQAIRVLSRNVSGDDVTEEFVDLESRLRNLEATQTRLLELLDRAETVEEALQVSNSLTNVQGQIEQVRGRMQYLQQSAALSTITVSLQEKVTTPVVDEPGWQPLEVARGALRALLNLAQALANMAIVLLVWVPFWLPIVLFGWWLQKRFSNRRSNKKPAGDKPAAPGSA